MCNIMPDMKTGTDRIWIFPYPVENVMNLFYLYLYRINVRIPSQNRNEFV